MPKLLQTALLFLLPCLLICQSVGMIDPSFGSNGRVIEDFIPGRFEGLTAIKEQSSGQLIVQGNVIGTRGEAAVFAR